MYQLSAFVIVVITIISTLLIQYHCSYTFDIYHVKHFSFFISRNIGSY